MDSHRFLQKVTQALKTLSTQAVLAAGKTAQTAWHMAGEVSSHPARHFVRQAIWASGHANPPPAGAGAVGVGYPSPTVVWSSNMTQMATTAAVLRVSAEAAAIGDGCALTRADERPATRKGIIPRKLDHQNQNTNS